MIQKTTSYFIIIISLLLFTNSVFALTNADKDGYYDISTCEDLSTIDGNLNLNFELIGNIDCTGIPIEPIGNSLINFTGNFNGNGYTISNLTITSTADCVGLFEYTSNNSIINVNIVDSQIDGESQGWGIGGLIGCAVDTEISQVSFSGDVDCNGSNFICGGIVGYKTGGDLNQSRFKGSINIFDSSSDMIYIGGLIGFLDVAGGDTSLINESYFEGDITSKITSPEVNIGGLVGYKYNSGRLTIKNSYSNITMKTNSFADPKVGGLVRGDTGDIFIQKSYSIGKIDTNRYSAGLIYSTVNFDIIHSFTTIDISGMDHLNGIIYTPIDPTHIENNWWYNTNTDNNTYLDVNALGNSTGITKATSNTDFYDSSFDVYTGAEPWDFDNVWLEGSSYPTLRWTLDTDGDGILDNVDRVLYTTADVTTEGISNLIITVGGQNINSAVSGEQTVIFYDGSTKLFNFDFNFDENVLDLSKITIKATSYSLLVNLKGQLQSHHTKSMYLANSNFVKFCVKDTEMSDIASVSAGCTDPEEIDFTRCLTSGTETINGIDCVYDFRTEIITINKLSNSGMIGTIISTPPGGGGGGGGGGGTGHHEDTNTDVNIEDTNIEDTNIEDTNIEDPYVDVVYIVTEDKPFVNVIPDTNVDENVTVPIADNVSWFNTVISNKTVVYSAAGLVILVILILVIIKIAKKKPEEPKGIIEVPNKKTEPKKKEEAKKKEAEPQKRNEDLSIDDYLKKQDNLKIADFLKQDSNKKK